MCIRPIAHVIGMVLIHILHVRIYGCVHFLPVRVRVRVPIQFMSCCVWCLYPHTWELCHLQKNSYSQICNFHSTICNGKITKWKCTNKYEFNSIMKTSRWCRHWNSLMINEVDGNKMKLCVSTTNFNSRSCECECECSRSINWHVKSIKILIENLYIYIVVWTFVEQVVGVENVHL
jgi:hypothetical protein